MEYFKKCFIIFKELGYWGEEECVNYNFGLCYCVFSDFK